MEYALVDTGVWYAMFDNRDQNYPKAKEKAELLDMVQIVLPWPVVYETLRTRFVRNITALQLFERFLKRRNIDYLDDSLYRDAAFDLSLESSLRNMRPLSMVDCLIRLVVEDVNTKIHYLATFNTADFSDVCMKNRVAII